MADKEAKRSDEPRFGENTPAPEWDRFEPLEELDNALLTKGQREFLLSGEAPNSGNRVKRSRIKSRFRRGLLDLALLARHLSPEEFQDTIGDDSPPPEGFDMVDVREGLEAALMFAAEGARDGREFYQMLEDELFHARHRQGDESLYRVSVDPEAIDLKRSDEWV